MSLRFVLVISLVVCFVTSATAGKRSGSPDGFVENPMLWADVPDPDVLRVGDTYYMVSTTMHLMPGAPIMRSTDLKNWQTVGYIFDRLTDSPRYDLQQGTVYGRGQWATSLKYHHGRFYALLAPNERGAMGDTYIYTALKAEGPWTLVSRLPHFHDCSLFFDDDDRAYAIYGTGEMMELKPDLTGVVEGSHQLLFQRDAEETGLLEGSRMVKHRGRYYLLMISQVWGVPGRHRREVCYRADDIRGSYEKHVILESDFGGFPYVGQGTIFDTPEGDWFAIIFQDRGGVGRVPLLMPCRWVDGWPMLGDEEGRVPERVRLPRTGQPAASIVCSDDFSATGLGLHWQWNHNPIDADWSLKARPGWLRLKPSRVVPNLYLAPNTLTQRMLGPQSVATVCLDLSHLRDGDRAGFAAFCDETSALTVRKAGRRLLLSMDHYSVRLALPDKTVGSVGEQRLSADIPLSQPLIWLRIAVDFRKDRDTATFHYSLNGTEWHQLGPEAALRYDWQRFFMASKFAVFCYATKRIGGWLDVDSFDITKTDSRLTRSLFIRTSETSS